MNNENGNGSDFIPSQADIDSNAATDALTLKQQEEIGKEISSKIQLVGDREPLLNLLNDYDSDDAVYRNKINEINKNYEFMRRIRPDGNCFFRAFSYGTLELILGKKEEIKSFREKIVEAKAQLTTAGYTQFTVEDFYDTYLETIDKVSSMTENKELDDLFKNDEGICDYMVVFLRLLTSASLKNEADHYQNFIDGGRTLHDFCQLEVEPMFKESDHIHIIALTKALGIGVRIIYMDRGAGSESNFPEELLPSLHFLYRPGHYELLYTNSTIDY